MPKPTGPTNEELQALILSLKKSKNKTYAYLAQQLAKPRRAQKHVNIGKIEKVAMTGENVIVPGKLLGSGTLTKKVNVYAWSYSLQAREKIVKAGGSCRLLDAMLKDQKQGRIVV